MLNQNSLAQLEGLKNKMESEKEWAQATIKGTQARYGFAILDDGREILVPPDEMLKTFPMDRVEVCIKPGKENRKIAEVHKLVSSNICEFSGQCVSKGKVLFVKPDLTLVSRWIFIPPRSRKGVCEGDYVQCKLLKHPIIDGRPQAEILEILGNKDTPNIENLYCTKKYKIASGWSEESVKEVENLIEATKALDQSHRKSLIDKDFISIDAARTQDIDDALYAEVDANGWNLYVAIADPTSKISPNSDLFKEICERATSIYLHGDLISMLPENLVRELFALDENQERNAIVCQMNISDQGEIKNYEFYEATVRSKAKLSYYSVDKYLNGQADELLSHATPLEPLYQLYRALRSWREENELVMEHRQEYRWILNDEKQIELIEPYEKLLSQKLVEECMVATNRSAADFLSNNNATGPFVNHPGFRQDRHEEVKHFLNLHCEKLASKDLNNLSDYREIITALSSNTQTLPLRSMINRLLARAELSIKPECHMGMNIDAYANCTSPLRKCVDFLTHIQIKSILQGKKAKMVDSKLLRHIEGKIQNVRKTVSEAENWLAGNYLQRLKLEGLQEFEGIISHINSSGFTVRLTSNGLTGFVDLRKDPEKFSFDKWTASLKSKTRKFQLNQLVRVSFDKVDVKNSFAANFQSVEGCGLEPTD